MLEKLKKKKMLESLRPNKGSQETDDEHKTLEAQGQVSSMEAGNDPEDQRDQQVKKDKKKKQGY